MNNRKKRVRKHNKNFKRSNFALLNKFLRIKTILCLHSNLPWVFFEKMPGNYLRNLFTKFLINILFITKFDYTSLILSLVMQEHNIILKTVLY